MNRATAMEGLGDALGVGPIPTSITGLVAALGGKRGGTRAVAGLMGVDLTDKSKEGKTRLNSAQRTIQRYMRAEAGETGKNVRGKTAKAHDALVGDLRGRLAEQQKAAALNKRPRGFHAKVTGNFFVSSSTYHRSVKPVYIDAASMEAIIDEIQDGDYSAAAASFSDAYGYSYDVPEMRWGEDDDDLLAFDSLVID